MKVEFQDLLEGNDKLKFVVIQASYNGKWIFVRHKDRNTWEIPGGHIEEKEDPNHAAERELMEETGALEYKLVPICNYSVEREGVKSFGRLYFAEIKNLGELGGFEIAEIMLDDKLPDKLTYEDIILHLFHKVLSEVNS